MAGEKDKNKPPLTKKDAALWKAMTGDVRRLPGREYQDGEEAESAPPEGGRIRERAGIKIRQPAPPPVQGREVDGRTAQRLARGKLPVEGTLDLHGMTQQEARAALTRFIKSSHSRGRRCVLVITGKGAQGKPGVLRTRVPEWLEEEPLGSLVLRTAQAKQQDGGLGAFYVLLRRRRET